MNGSVRAESATASTVPAQTALTTVAQVRALTPEQAARHLPVHLHGALTAYSGWEDSFFFEDATGGLAVNRWERAPAGTGHTVDLYGVTDPGKFANSVDSTQLIDRGPGPVPPSRLYRFADLLGGGLDARWIEVQGVIQAAQVQHIWGHDVLVLALDAGEGPISVRLANYQPGDAARLVDAIVSIRGVCGTEYNSKRQFIGLRLFVTDSRQIRVIDPAPADPFATPLSPLRIELQPGSAGRHRIKVAGTVTFQSRGRVLFLQDGSDGMLVVTDQGDPVPLGARVEAIGFPSFSGYTPSLRHGRFRILGPGAPVPVAHEPFANESSFVQQADTFQFVPYDGQLVEMQGVLIERTRQVDGDSWLLRSGERSFLAILDHGQGKPPAIEVGSTVSVTGIFSVTTDEDRHPQSFHILLRSPSDLVLVKRASWWTPEHALGLLSVVLILTLVIGLWGILLRLRVRQQTRLLRESEERFRIQAQQDTLTGLASRSLLHDKLREALERAESSGNPIGVLMIDLDHFKQVNDTQGHHAGDELLRIVAGRIRASVRKTDTVARMGGDEFVVLLEELTHPEEAEWIGAKVVANVSAPAEVCCKTMPISASVGVCLYPEGGATVDQLLQNVDAAMYQAKAAGRNSFSVYRPEVRFTLSPDDTPSFRAALGEAVDAGEAL